MRALPAYPRIRKTIKWGGAALAVLLVAVWVGSMWWIAVGVGPGEEGLLIAYGHIGIFDATDRGWSWHLEPSPFNPYSRSLHDILLFGSWKVVLPLWHLALPAAFLSALAWRLDLLARRRARQGPTCPKCNYPRAGLAGDAVCPECGSPPPPSAPDSKEAR